MARIRPQNPSQLPTLTDSEANTIEVVEKKEQQVIAETVHEISIEYQNSVQGLILKVGNIILEKIFINDIKAASEINKRNPESAKIHLFYNLIDELAKLSHTGNVPKKTWLYNAVNLALQERQIQDNEKFDQLSVSHKIELLAVKDQTKKVDLIEKINQKALSVRATREAVKETKQVRQQGIPSLTRIIANPRLAFGVELKNIKPIKGYRLKKAQNEISASKKLIEDEIARKKKELDILMLIEEDIGDYIR